MSDRNLVITIVAHHEYICRTENPEKYVQQHAQLFSAISNTYLPLLKMFTALESDGVPFRLAMVFSPTLCALLADPQVQVRYLEWLDTIISLGEAELSRIPESDARHRLASAYLSRAIENRTLFIEKYKHDILAAFKRFADSGHIELIATTATYAFLPHYHDMGEALNAQIETGLLSHKHFFSVAPEGFWLPYMGYMPGIEKTLRSYNINYTILNSHGLLFASPLPENGIFSPVRCANSLAVFVRDSKSPDDLSGEDGFIHNSVYCNHNRDLVFEESADKFAGFIDEGNARIPSGYAYWANDSSPYDPESALRQVQLDAQSFLEKKGARLADAKKTCGTNVSLICTFNARLLGQTWHEGVDWLEAVFRKSATKTSSPDSCTPPVLTHGIRLLDNQSEMQKVSPFFSADSGAGYGEDLMDSSNAWMLRYVRKACERMIDLADRFPDERGLRSRALNLAAKAVLLAQSGDFSKMLHHRHFPEYAEASFKDCIFAFTTVFESLGANNISTAWLTETEKKYELFSWINYRVFSKKKEQRDIAKNKS